MRDKHVCFRNMQLLSENIPKREIQKLQIQIGHQRPAKKKNQVKL